MRLADRKAEGYRVIHEAEPTLNETVRQFKALVTERDPDKRAKIQAFEAKIAQIIADPDNHEEIDLEKLSRLPNFDLDGFQSDVDPLDQDRDTPIAPLSKEQMRLLLSSVVPAAMLPFVNERLVFEFAPTKPGDEHKGPEVYVKKNSKDPDDPDYASKIHIRFNRHHFISKGVPPELISNKKSKKNAELVGLNADDPIGKAVGRFMTRKDIESQIAGFIDPSRISIFLGKIFAEMIPPPPPEDPTVAKVAPYARWASILKERPKNKNGRSDDWLTKDKHDKKAWQHYIDALDTRKVDGLKDAKLHKKWQDFVSLAVTAPNLASQRFPEAYKYFTQAAEKFNTDPNQDELAIKRVGDAALENGGTLQLADFGEINDLRTITEKKQDEGMSPQLAWYEKFVTGVNRTLADFQRIPLLGRLPLFGMKLTYRLPERSNWNDEDDKEAKRLMEQSFDKVSRDEDLVRLITTAGDFDPTARKKALQYLVGISQAGDFAEWRVFLWLHKFSRTFRDWGGQFISEQDYKDLDIIYGQSEKAGRLGTGVLPYTTTKYEGPDAQYHGTRKPIYQLKDRGKYLKDVQDKIRTKNITTIASASAQIDEKGLKQFMKPGDEFFGFNETFGGDAAGLQTQTVNLEQLGVSPEVGALLGQLGINKVSPDARALAEAYFDYYRDRQFKSDRYISPLALEIVTHYKSNLNTPPEHYIKKLFDIDAKALAEQGDFDRIVEKFTESEQAREAVMQTLGVELDKPPYDRNLLDDIKKKMTEFIEKGATHLPVLLAEIEPILQFAYQGNQENIALARLTISRFMYDSKVIKNLALLDKIIKYRKELHVPAAIEIRQSADQLAKLDKGVLLKLIADKGRLPHAAFEDMRKNGLPVSSDDIARIKNADKDLLTAAAGNEENKTTATDAPAQPEANVDERDDSEAKQEKRAQIVAEKIASSETDPLVREAFVINALERSLNNLQKTFIYTPSSDSTDSVPTTLAERYAHWESDAQNRIYDLAPLRTVKNTISVYVAESSSTDPKLQSNGLNGLSREIAKLARAINFEKARISNAKNPKKNKPLPPEEESSGG